MWRLSTSCGFERTKEMHEDRQRYTLDTCAKWKMQSKDTETLKLFSIEKFFFVSLRSVVRMCLKWSCYNAYEWVSMITFVAFSEWRKPLKNRDPDIRPFQVENTKLFRITFSVRINALTCKSIQKLSFDWVWCERDFDKIFHNIQQSKGQSLKHATDYFNKENLFQRKWNAKEFDTFNCLFILLYFLLVWLSLRYQMNTLKFVYFFRFFFFVHFQIEKSISEEKIF